MKAYGGLPPPVDQPTLEDVSKGKTCTPGDSGGDDGGGEGDGGEGSGADGGGKDGGGDGGDGGGCGGDGGAVPQLTATSSTAASPL